jgi:hypothetical protein
MELFWTDDTEQAITAVLGADDRLANFFGPTTVTVPVASGNADYEYIVSEIGLDQVGPPRPADNQQEQAHGQRRTSSPPPLRRR